MKTEYSNKCAICKCKCYSYKPELCLKCVKEIIDETIRHYDKRRGGMLDRVYVGDFAKELKRRITRIR